MRSDNPSEEDLQIWENYFVENEDEQVSKLIEEAEPDKWRSLKLNLSNLANILPLLFEKIRVNPILELEHGEFVLQRIVEGRGGQFNINLQYTDLPDECYKNPANISVQDIRKLIWFDSFPSEIYPIKPWHKIAAWRCVSCERITLKENKVGVSISRPLLCAENNGGCGAINEESLTDYIRIFDNESKSKRKLTTFELVPYYGTLLDYRPLRLVDASMKSPKFKKLGNVVKHSIFSIAIGPIAHKMRHYRMVRVTGQLNISEDGTRFEFEILGIRKVPDERMEEILSDGAEQSSVTNTSEEE
jgi:DNA replicative helicase MCM subunit Mcm2 (Cdc46/Mcm family)